MRTESIGKVKASMTRPRYTPVRMPVAPTDYAIQEKREQFNKLPYMTLREIVRMTIFHAINTFTGSVQPGEFKALKSNMKLPETLE